MICPWFFLYILTLAITFIPLAASVNCKFIKVKAKILIHHVCLLEAQIRILPTTYAAFLCKMMVKSGFCKKVQIMKQNKQNV